MIPETFDWLPDMVWVSPSVLVQVVSCASLMYTTCEWLNSLPFEVSKIWKSTDIPFYLRFIYISSRYVGLAAQGLHLFAFNYLLTTTTSPPSTCNLYWFVQQYIGAIALLALQIVLSKRVYALWNGHPRIAAVLLSLFVLDLGAAVTFTTMAMGGITYINMNCFMVEHLPREVMYLCVTQLFVQTCLWTLAYVKYTTFAHEPSHKETNQLVSRLNREHMLVAFLACLIPATVLADGVWGKITTDVSNISYPAFPVFLAIVTSVTCRTIKNMHGERLKMMIETAGNEEEGYVLTSIDFEQRF